MNINKISMIFGGVVLIVAGLKIVLFGGGVAVKSYAVISNFGQYNDIVGYVILIMGIYIFISSFGIKGDDE